jgi:hypothetical protein
MENTQLPTFADVDPSSVILVEDDFESSTEETQEEIEETENPIESDEPVEQVDDPLARATYEALVERGLLEEDETFSGNFDHIEEKLDALPAKLLREAINELPNHSQSVLNYIATAGDNLTPDELKTFMREYLGEENLPDVSTLDSARSFLEDEFKAQGLRYNAIQAQLDDLEDSDELLSEAEKILKSKGKKTDTLIQDKERENQQMVEDQKQFYQSVTTALGETKWAKSQQDKILQIIPKANSIMQESIKQPKAYVQLMDFLSKFNGKEFDLEVYKKQGEARATSNIREKLEKSGFSSASKTSSSDKTPTKDSFKNYELVV